MKQGRRSQPLILMPTTGRVWEELTWALGELRFSHGWGYCSIKGSAYLNQARGRLVHAALSTASEWFVWVDEDMIFPAAMALELLEEAKREGLRHVGAIYRVREATTEPTEAKYVPADCRPYTGLKESKATVGFGLTVTHRSVFEEIPHEVCVQNDWYWTDHFDSYRVETESGTVKATDDVALCHRMRANKIPVMCHTDYFPKHDIFGGEPASAFAAKHVERSFEEACTLE